MSKSLHYVRSRTMNNIVREHDNIVNFLTPIGRGVKYSSGETIRTSMIPYSDIHQVTSGVTDTSFVEVAYYDYVPANSSSKIIIDYVATYSVGGNAATTTDAFLSAITVTDSDNNVSYIGKGFQQWNAAGNPVTTGGTGTRSGTIFPLMGAYTNSSPNSIRISILVRRSGGDDNVVISADEGTWLKVTEVAL